SLHNSQPWAFRLHDGAVDVRIDPGRGSAVGGRAGWAARVACGAAALNARLALATNGTPAVVRIRPDPTDDELIARLAPTAARPATMGERDLAAAVARRRSNRAPFWADPVPADLRARLLDAARAEGCWLELLIGMTALSGFAEIAQSADRVLRRDSAYQAEQGHWTDPSVAGDGVPVNVGARVTEPQDLLPQRAYSDRPRAPGRDFEAEPLIAILGSTGDCAGDQIAAGLALQRVLLTATDAGLATSMISQPIEVPSARDQLRRSLGRSGTPQMALRIGYGQPGSLTPRRRLGDVIVS
ncbi:MAG TPA: nitroreductase, partial [Catenuloplanes sp.]